MHVYMCDEREMFGVHPCFQKHVEYVRVIGIVVSFASLHSVPIGKIGGVGIHGVIALMFPSRNALHVKNGTDADARKVDTCVCWVQQLHHNDIWVHMRMSSFHTSRTDLSTK